MRHFETNLQKASTAQWLAMRFAAVGLSLCLLVISTCNSGGSLSSVESYIITLEYSVQYVQHQSLL